MKKIYGDYDYENEYKRQITNLEEEEYRRYLKERRVGYLYATKTITSGKMVEVEIYPVFKEKKDLPRKKEKKSRKAQRNLNDKNARKKLIRLMNTNFDTNGYWATFNFAEDPKDLDEAEKIVGNFIRRLNYRRKKSNLPQIKYIYVVEIGKNGRSHVHMVMDNLLDRDTIEDTWKHGKRNHVRRLDPDDFGLTGIATYLSKDPKGRKRWKASRNLRQPKVTQSLTKFKRGRVLRMVKNQNEIETEMKKEYPKLKYLDTEVRQNEVNGLFYLYTKMTRRE